MVCSIFLRIRGSTIRMRPRKEVPAEWAARAEPPVALFRVIRRGIDNGYMVILIRSVVPFAGAGVNGIRNASGARLPIGAVRGITPERGLIPLEDRSNYDREAGDCGELQSCSRAAEIA
jgi:hypothetical protein